jgi:glutaminyl-tRNA synthetase
MADGVGDVGGAGAERPRHFIRQIIDADNASKKWGTWPDGRPKVCTRFPPEPNGYLHIGHAKSISLNFGLAEEYGGTCNLRFDDTNPEKEEDEYVRSIIADVKWLVPDWEGTPLYASDYFPQMYEWAEKLVRQGDAYVCDCNAEQVRSMRGNTSRPGTPCVHRDRTPDENLTLFRAMRAGEFADGSRTLRAKIDMASPNFNLRDPVMYRIMKAEHHRTGNAWCIYPMYDWAHGLEDSIEGITHSICTLEFEDHRPLYDWFIERLGIHHPQQIEFARFNLNYTVMSKRKLLRLVKENHVRGWDDPRMPTLSGLRRRGYTAGAIKRVCEEVGTSKFKSVIDIVRLENSLRDDLNATAPRRLAVLRPLKVVIENFPDGETESMDLVNNPEDPSAGTRSAPFCREIYIDRDDFMEVPPPKYFRLAPGAEVRLRGAYWIRCTGVEKNAAGEVTLICATYDPQTKGGESPPDGRKVKGTIHWVSARHAIEAEVRLFDRLFSAEDPESGEGADDFLKNLNPHSLEVLKGARLEPSLKDAKLGDTFQFERLGYFNVDLDSKPGAVGGLVFNRTVTLKDSWAKEVKK